MGVTSELVNGGLGVTGAEPEVRTNAADCPDCAAAEGRCRKKIHRVRNNPITVRIRPKRRTVDLPNAVTEVNWATYYELVTSGQSHVWWHLRVAENSLHAQSISSTGSSSTRDGGFGEGLRRQNSGKNLSHKQFHPMANHLQWR